MRRTILFAAAVFALLAGAAAGDTISHIQQPTKVPAFESFLSLGNGIEPGKGGIYGFTLRNRYNGTMGNISLTVEIYKWATTEEARDLQDVPFPPRFAATGRPVYAVAVPALDPNETVDIRAGILTVASTPEGVYFTRHLIEFDYPNFTLRGNATPVGGHFAMKSRGFFTEAEFRSINYSDLEESLVALNVAGIVPDSSFSVKGPMPLWPLALVVGAAAVTGGLALASYIADANPERHPELKRRLLRLSGWARVYRELLLEAVRARLPRRGSPPPGPPPGPKGPPR